MPIDLSQLLDGLQSPDPARRVEAAERLARLGPDARDAALDLVRACRDEEEAVREGVTAALEALGPPKVSDVDALCALLATDDADTAYWAATLLGRLEGGAGSAVPALATAL